MPNMPLDKAVACLLHNATAAHTDVATITMMMPQSSGNSARGCGAAKDGKSSKLRENVRENLWHTGLYLATLASGNLGMHGNGGNLGMQK